MPARTALARLLPRTVAALLLPVASLASAQATAAPSAASPRPALAEPSLSPDGREVAFVTGGDVWTVGADGGEARLLVSHPAHESRPLWSPDGRRLAFVSTRTGGGDVYVLELASGAVRRLTFDDAPETLDAWSRDGRWVYLSTASRDVAGMQDVLRVAADGGTPMVVAGDRYASEYWAAPAPDGRTLAITARGVVSGQWWRRGHSHIDESEIWTVRPAEGSDDAPTYAAVTTGGAKDAWPMWAPDGGTLYFMSDRSGAENLWAQPMANGRASGAPRALTTFTDGRVLWPQVALDGRTLVFERDFGLWRLDVAGGVPRALPVTLRGASATSGIDRLSAGAGLGAQELALSPDGRKLAFVMRGEIFAAASRAPEGAAAGGGGPADAARVTSTPGAEQQATWSPDSRRLAYASDRDGRWRLWTYDFGTRREVAVTRGAGAPGDPSAGDVAPHWSPDGRRIAFVRGGRELRVVDVSAAAGSGDAPGRERLLATGRFDRPPFTDPGDVAWSPDGQWIAFAARAGGNGFMNAFVVRTGDVPGEPRQVSFLPNTTTGQLAWSADGTALFLTTGQRTETVQVARIDLVPRTPRFREDQFRDLFTTSTPGTTPGTTPGRDSSVERRAVSVERDSATRSTLGARRSTLTRIDFDAIRTRLSILPVGLSVQEIAPSPDGRQLLVVAATAGQTNLWLWPLDELAPGQPVARQLTSTAGDKRDAQWTADGREVYYREGGRANAVTVESRAVRTIAVNAEMDADFAREKEVVFGQAWGWLRDHFYDAKYHGADWEAVRTRVAPAVAASRTPDELRRVLNLMVGELNASHLGVNGPGGGGAPTTGRLGVRFDRAAYERDGTLRVREVLPLGPAALAGIRVGDVLRTVDGSAVARGTNLDSLLAHTVGRRVTLGLASTADARREVVVRPVSLGVEKGLLYRGWVESRRAYVAQQSGGALGYVHMPDMSAGSLDQLYADLDAENVGRAGVVIDLRNNNGGFVNAYALDVFARRPYLTMTLRDDAPTPARAQLGQRALERPTVLVVNQHSLSDAEDFTEGYRALGLGKVVGEPTAGWIIFTWNVPMLDGSVLRLPRARITGADGKDMERNPRPVDVRVVRAVGESYGGTDAQLDAAVQVLMNRK